MYPLSLDCEFDLLRLLLAGLIGWTQIDWGASIAPGVWGISLFAAAAAAAIARAFKQTGFSGMYVNYSFSLVEIWS